MMTLVFAFLLLMPADLYQRVAFDDGGVPDKQPHLLSGGIYQYPDAPEGLDATVAFGREVVFGYDGLNPRAGYRLRITFVSDGRRVQNLFAGDAPLEERILIEKYAPITREFDLPRKAYAKGQLLISVIQLEGPNAVVSSIEILSTDPGQPAPLPEPSPPEFTMPRLSPMPDRVFPVIHPVLSLDGTWRFHPDAPADFMETGKDGKAIQVPGQWVQQGFTVEKGEAGTYFRTFDLPSDWKDMRIKLRCDAVYSEATVYLNSREAGRHLGGFTPFELDVTGFVRPGANTLAMAVKSHSLADTLASGIQYATHDLGGIPRKLCLVALPRINVAGLHVETWFDDGYRDATLKVLLEIANEGPDHTGPMEMRFQMNEWPAGPVQSMQGEALSMEAPPPGMSMLYRIDIPVEEPKQWHAETPNLYTLVAELSYEGELRERVMRRFGFRQVEVRGDELLVNGRPVKLRGVCRHEAHPSRGRSLRPEDWHRDAELFREANCNYIRTSHYPPAEEFIAACDELGLFVEEEAPLCWVGHGANPTWTKWDPHDDEYFAYIQQCILEMIQRDRSHPSVIIWSLANESAWGRNWQFANANAAEADPTRPRSFHDQCYGGYNNLGSTVMPIANMHYPGPEGAKNAATIMRPLLFGEYAHLNAYNRFELITDPGVRDAWGRGFARMWETMQATDGLLGGAIWSGIDDSFFLPSDQVVGYGTWGPIDGWRRKKPEFWHVKKAYSPVRVHLDRVSAEGIPVENRHDVLNLKDLEITWTAGEGSGTCISDVPPRSEGLLEIPVESDLKLEIRSPRGYLIDAYRTGKTLSQAGKTKQSKSDSLDEQSLDNHPTLLSVDGKPVLIDIPQLMILPLNSKGGTQMRGGNQAFAPDTATCSDWERGRTELQSENYRTVIKVQGEYAEAEGSYTLYISTHGKVEVQYRFTCKAEINPRQIGMVFTLPRAFDTLTWSRNGQWSAYPPDHIGRLEGTAVAFPTEERTGPAGPAAEPSRPWSRDTTDLGSNEFRSTKENIDWATLTDKEGDGLRVVSDARHHVRAWVEGDRVRLLVAYYNNPGAEQFFRSHAAREDKPLKPGDTIEDRIHLEWCSLEE